MVITGVRVAAGFSQAVGSLAIYIFTLSFPADLGFMPIRWRYCNLSFIIAIRIMRSIITGIGNSRTNGIIITSGSNRSLNRNTTTVTLPNGTKAIHTIAAFIFLVCCKPLSNKRDIPVTICVLYFHSHFRCCGFTVVNFQMAQLSSSW